MIKPGTLYIDNLTGTCSFVGTDGENEIDVLYRGTVPFECKEGSTIVSSCYFPTSGDKTRVVALDFLTNHSMEVENWSPSVEQEKNNFGLKSAKE